MQVKQLKNPKKYSPVRVANPTGDGHLVCLQPNQGFVVIMSPAMDFKTLDYHSKYFLLHSTETSRNGSTIFTFRQKYDLTQWARIGSAYLGEVLILTENTLSSLCVTLTSKQTDVLSIVNPNGAEVKAHPHQILEVVIYDKIFHGQWNCKLVPGEDGVQYRQIGRESIYSSEDVQALVSRMKTAGNFVVFPRSFEDYEGQEHHYWFELDIPSIKKVAEWKTGTYYGGRLVFEPSINDGEQPSPNVLHVQLGMRRKNRLKLQHPKRLPDSLPFDIAPTQGRSTTHTTQAKRSGAYDDFQAGHSPDYRARDNYRDDYSFQGGRSRRHSGVATVYYNARPFRTTVTIKERIIASTADPLYVGATIETVSSVIPIVHDNRCDSD